MNNRQFAVFAGVVLIAAVMLGFWLMPKASSAPTTQQTASAPAPASRSDGKVRVVFQGVQPEIKPLAASAESKK